MAGGRPLPVVQPGGLPAAPLPFDRIAVVGLDAAGGSVAMAVRRAWRGALVIGVDRNDRLEKAMRLAAVDVGADDPIVVAEADLVVLAVPLAEQERWLAALPGLISGPAVVTTLTCADGVPAAAAALPDRFIFIGGHACTADGPGDLTAARPDRFAGVPWVLLTAAAAPGAVRLDAFVRAVGASPVPVADGVGGLRAFLAGTGAGAGRRSGS